MIWEIGFIFGSSKSIHTLDLSAEKCHLLLVSLPKNVSSVVKKRLGEFAEYLRHSDILHMQDVWSHRGPGGTRPFMMLDGIDKVGAELISVIAGHEDITKIAVADVIKAQYRRKTSELAGLAKL